MLAIIVSFIWWVRAAWPWAWVAPFVFMLASTIMGGEWRPRLDRFVESWRAAGWVVFAVASAALAVAAWVGWLRAVSLSYALGGLFLYCLWGVFQEYVLNGFFVPRLQVVAARRSLVPPAAGALFAVVHWPNPFLVVATFAGGWIASSFFLRHRSVLFLGLAHGVVGTVLFLGLPDSITHHLNVGPGYVRLCRSLHGGAHLWLVRLPRRNQESRI